MDSPSVVVVGAGVVGLSVAFHLSELGADHVTVIDKAHVASGSSGLSVGIVETQYLDPLDIELRVISSEFFNRLERDYDLQIVRNGYLRLANSEDEVALFEKSVKIQRELGVRDSRVLDAAGVKEVVPDLRCDDVVAGLFGPSDGYIDGHLYCNLLRDLVTEQGVKVLTRAALIGEEPGTERQHRIITTQDEIECDFVVNAAGPWAGEVGEMLGTPVSQLPQRHQVVIAHLAHSLDYVMPSIMDYVPGSGEYGFYCRYESPLQLLTGLHTEEPLLDVVDPNTYNRSVDNEFLELVAEKFARRLPELRDAKLAHGWAGLYPISPDGLAQVGPNSIRTTIVSTCGVGGSGLQTSPAYGRIAAEWIMFGEPRSIAGAMRLAPSRDSLTKEVIG